MANRVLSHSTAIYALTPQGFSLAKKLATLLYKEKNSSDSFTIFIPKTLCIEEDTLFSFHQFSTLASIMGENFVRYKQHIFIAAMGIIVRSISPHIKSKTTDPAVVAIDQKGSFVISVLSGHIGKANDLTTHLAHLLNATPVITTATDVEGLPAIDSLAVKKGLAMNSMEAAKYISAALLASKPIMLYDPEDWLTLKKSEYSNCFIDISTIPISFDANKETPYVIVTEKAIQKNSFALVLSPPLFCAGIGCKRGTKSQTILAQLEYAFASNGLSLASLHSLASIDIKKNEEGLLETAQQLNVPLFFYSPEELRQYPTKNTSKKCLHTFGIQGVCESASLATAGENAQLIQEKIAANGVTVAIAKRFLPKNS